MATPLRRTVEKHSVGPLTWLASRPKWVPFGIVLVLLLGGLFLPVPVAAVLLAALVLFLGWLTYLGWPKLDSAGRLVRLAMLVLVLYVLVQRLLSD
ncbi:MAG: hypothetical protein AVDCRST_MAG41-3350 [uncultured Corynebacteriales bacterium]|uniref:Uncharacterized protein n=1 Tax=uncultured Mycobacteriales bacterium TaxID=581187 RepID=A0A6J4JIC2_9ACTN|nr:MAG: hypothetical protein AVDCRST_MAG41-3350 [uncultured Corynebacteriales bacterium]